MVLWIVDVLKMFGCKFCVILIDIDFFMVDVVVKEFLDVEFFEGDLF